MMEACLHDRQTWLAAHNITPGLPEPEHRRCYLAIPVQQRRAFERDQARRYFRELDLCHGACHLRSPQAAAVVSDALHYHHTTRLLCGDYVVMPNHVHWLLLPLEGHSLEDILFSVKRWIAGRINTLVGRTGKLWQKESYDHIVRDPDEFNRIRDYIEQNPGKAKLRASEFLYHRADWV
ncbi:MAG: hypothetical protein RBU21_00225 [FCB group bacterium]|jgi:type I restriction enzyme R subunit|nr:hypothetical protein [FCB group bacterium]